MSANEKQNSNVLENREYQNQNQNTANENAVVNEELYGIDDFKTHNDEDFLNSDYPEDEDEDEDDEDLEEEAESSVDEPGSDFNEIEEAIEDPEEENDIDEDSEEGLSEEDLRRL